MSTNSRTIVSFSLAYRKRLAAYGRNLWFMLLLLLLLLWTPPLDLSVGPPVPLGALGVAEVYVVEGAIYLYPPVPES